MRTSLRKLKQLGVPVGSVIDVGVNHSTRALMEAFPRHKHILVEPISDYFAAIRKNYAGMDYDLIEAAAGDVDAVVHIESFSKLGDGKVSHSAIVGEAGPNTREIPCVRLDTIIPKKGLKAPYLLKIDVEGAGVPAAILRGATETLRQSSVVVIELTATRFMERVAIIHQAGFQLFDIVDACYYRKTLAQVDAVFVRDDIAAATPGFQPMNDGPFDPKAWRPVRPPIWERVVERLRAKAGL